MRSGIAREGDTMARDKVKGIVIRKEGKNLSKPQSEN